MVNLAISHKEGEMRRVLVTTVLMMIAGLMAWTQELPAPDDHAKILFENDQVRVLRYHYEPKDKSQMHTHPDNVQILFTDSQAKVYAPDGKASDSTGKAEDVRWRKGGTHSVENTGDKAAEGILVELKAKPGATTQTLSAPDDHAK